VIHQAIVFLPLFLPLIFLQFESDFSIPFKSIALSLHKTLSDLSKLERLDGTNYRHWPQKLLIFFEQLEVDHVLFSNPTKESSTFETTIAFGDETDKSKSIND